MLTVLTRDQLNVVPAVPPKTMGVKASPEQTVWLGIDTVTVGFGFIVCVMMLDVLVSNVLLTSKYTAVIEWFPGTSVEIEKVAILPATDEVPSTVTPSKNCTEPVAPTEGVMLAVNVILVFSHTERLLEPRVVVVAICPLTVPHAKANTLTNVKILRYIFRRVTIFILVICSLL